ncbi:MAG: TIGR04283 family arsenosugar biosynthesis glycosyltransferase [Syntrophomonadaceae bacterium]|nr:TIGR04283 family arsenosugar biosynthesis glycosyltransferase [Syntrophomonadaceae bacterium]MDD4550240.1 TIGR04283 family arsenosugar biosynthesis glycosyltransferase [Syntrophomonadaceae bacterium]
MYTQKTLPRISVVVPVLNEAKIIDKLLGKISNLPGTEVIICDGGSTDDTVKVCRRYTDNIVHSRPGRGFQLNRGAEQASGDILFFLHADSLIDTKVFDDIRQAIEHGYYWGCCTIDFDEDSLFFRLLAWFSTWRAKLVSSCYGDQGIYCLKDIFNTMQGFPETPFLEDIAFSRKIRRHYRAHVIPGRLTTSARRFREGGIFKTIVKMQFIKILYKLGMSPQYLIQFYKSGKQREFSCE